MITISDGMEPIKEFLATFGIVATSEPNEGGTFNREIFFTVNGAEYVIVWYPNEAKLKMGRDPRAAFIPFRAMYHDTTFPLVGGNSAIGFSYQYNTSPNFWDRVFPYESFRIPTETTVKP